MTTIPEPDATDGGGCQERDDLVSWVLNHSATTHSARLVLISLAHLCHIAGRADCDPSIADIAELASVNTAVAGRAIKALHDEGHITRIVQGSRDAKIPGGRRPNRYIVHRDKAEIDRLRDKRSAGATNRGEVSQSSAV